MTEQDFNDLDNAMDSFMAKDGATTVATAVSSNASVNSPAPSIQDANGGLAAKRRGKFMDMVHPSADMTAKEKPAVHMTSGRREGVAIAPMHDDVAISKDETRISPTPAAHVDVMSPSLEMEATGSPDGTAPIDIGSIDNADAANPPAVYQPAVEMPDQIDAMERAGEKYQTQVQAATIGPEQKITIQDNITESVGHSDTPPTESSKVQKEMAELLGESQTNDELARLDQIDFPDNIEPPEPSEPPENTSDLSPSSPPAETPVDKADTPLESPFLPDAKVDKRPLDALAGASVSVQPEKSVSIELPIEPEGEPAKQLPPELSADLMSIESSTTQSIEPLAAVSDDTAAIPSSPEPKQPQEPVPAAASETKSVPPPKTEPEPEISHVIEPKGPPMPPPAPTPVSAEALIDDMKPLKKTGTPIFDTTTYHQPLSHPDKHTSSFLVIVAILVLLILGTLAGAAYFYFTSGK